jgi:hypothetical protein
MKWNRVGEGAAPPEYEEPFDPEFVAVLISGVPEIGFYNSLQRTWCDCEHYPFVVQPTHWLRLPPWV